MRFNPAIFVFFSIPSKFFSFVFFLFLYSMMRVGEMTSFVSTKAVIVTTIAATAFAIYQVSAMRNDWKAARDAVKAERAERRARRARVARLIGSLLVAGCAVGGYLKFKSLLGASPASITTTNAKAPVRKTA